MAAQGRFPSELLSQSKEARLAYFKKKIIRHPKLEDVHNRLIRAIHEPAGASLVFLYGPTGIGKTTLLGRIREQLVEDTLPELETDCERLPVGLVTAVSPELGNFNWRDFYIRALTEFHEPLIDKKIDHSLRVSQNQSGTPFGFSAGSSVSELRRAFEECLRHRRPYAFIIDEAQHLRKMATGRRLLDQMDALKSLADLARVVLVLAGTYELLDLTNLSAQLSRRSIDIHFSRYRYDNADEVEIFRAALRTFQVHLPVSREPNLEDRWEDFYERSLGCIGVLKTWLDQSLAASLEDCLESIPNKYFERYALPLRKLAAMARELEAGERQLAEKDGKQFGLRMLLGIEAVPAQGDGIKPPQDKHGSKRPTGRVGQRNPVRDPVGSEERLF